MTERVEGTEAHLCDDDDDAPSGCGVAEVEDEEAKFSGPDNGRLPLAPASGVVRY